MGLKKVRVFYDDLLLFLFQMTELSMTLLIDLLTAVNYAVSSLYQAVRDFHFDFESMNLNSS